MQGDRIVGRETIPILIGEKRTMRLLKYILVLMIVFLILSSSFNLVSSLGYILFICPLFLFFVITVHEQDYMLSGTKLEFLVETHFVLAGLLALLWSYVL
jgi:4-hydroxy-3-methylbut-2-enyl diphosphate reductase